MLAMCPETFLVVRQGGVWSLKHVSKLVMSVLSANSEEQILTYLHSNSIIRMIQEGLDSERFVPGKLLANKIETAQVACNIHGLTGDAALVELLCN